MSFTRPSKGMARGFSGTTGGFPASVNPIKTTESTESNMRTDSGSRRDYHYHNMRQSTSSELRQKAHRFGKSPQHLSSLMQNN